MKKYFLYTVVIMAAIACGTSKPGGSNVTQNPSYKKELNTIHPQFVVFNSSDSSSELHFKIASKELLYMRPDGLNFTCNVLISYRMYASYDSKEIVDSGSVRLIDQNNAGTDKFLVGKMNVRALSPHSYFVRLKVTDLNRNNEVTAVTSIEKDNDLNRQNFLVKSAATDIPVFRSYVKPGEELSISYKAKIGVTVFVRYYNREFPLAVPPFSLTEPKPFHYQPDSTYTLELKNGTTTFIAGKKGFYHIQLDTTKRDGITLFNFSDAFPEVKKADDMVLPLRYITSKQEYEELTGSANKKASVEKFWLDCTGNQERAKEIIRKYYNRVQDGNAYFTSYVEGWKTDRGMIYLIYGSPNVIYKTDNSETWTYGEENNINSLTYVFSKVNNPFTDNDYSLDRSANYKQAWYSAVDIWRQGRAYLQD
jgi:GWxTD domain-containing protein